MFDIEKAFDNIDHEILIQILEDTDMNKNSLYILKLLLNHFNFTILGEKLGYNS